MENFSEYYNQPNVCSDEVKSIYEQLAEKEEELLLAAQFGKSLLDEKEKLEMHIEMSRKDYESRIEFLEQEKHELKLIIESIKNEYENKIYELNDDLAMLREQFHAHLLESNLKLNENKSYVDIINELNEKIQKFSEEIKSKDECLVSSELRCHKLEDEIEDMNLKYTENVQQINNLKIELNNQIKKQHELEYILIQTCKDRDTKCSVLDEINKKLITIENEKKNLNQIIFQQERQIIELQRLNEDLSIKLKRTKNLPSPLPRSLSLIHNMKSFYDYEDDVDIDVDVDDSNEDFESYMDLFKINDGAAINWQDECQLSEQMNSQNSNNSDDYESNNMSSDNQTTTSESSNLQSSISFFDLSSK